jgi:predicted ATPase
VALIDELYDREVTVVASGCGVCELFPANYRGGGYRKKYGRAESRLSAMLGEAVQVPASRATTGASASRASAETPR